MVEKFRQSGCRTATAGWSGDPRGRLRDIAPVTHRRQTAKADQATKNPVNKRLAGL
jgi:hypothetical protein